MTPLPTRTPSEREYAADRLVHIVGIMAGVSGAAILLVAVAIGGRPWELAATFTYSSGLVAMLTCSACYNLSRSSKRRELLRRIDQAAIFVMIAGTYTPFTTLRLDGAWGVGLTVAVWCAAAAGVTGKLLWPRLLKRLSLGLYLTLGWVGIIAIGPLFVSVGPTTLTFLALGGVLYSIGVVFHVWESLPFQNAVWHGFVLVAAGMHYVAVVECVVVQRAPI